MARYRGPKQKIARRFGEPIFGPSKSLERKPYAPGQHGNARRRKESEYSVQLKEKQKAKSTKEWTERLEGIKKAQSIKQKKREENLAKRKEEKGKKGGKKKARPGFEGTFRARTSSAASKKK